MSDIVLTKDSAPLTPPAGTLSIYAKTDGKLYRMDESGVEHEIASAGAFGTAAYADTTDFDAAGSSAAAQSAAIASSLQKAANLSDLASAATARTNLGLGSAATQSSSAFDAAGAAAAAQAASDPLGSATTAQAASLQKSSNLSDLVSASTARTNLGLSTVAATGAYSDLTGKPTLGTAAAQNTSAFDAAGTASAVLATSLQKASNLSDLASASTARTNLGIGNVDNTSDANKPVSTATQTALNLKINSSLIGAASGVCPLDSTSKISSTYLPSFVDDVLEYANLAAFPGAGDTGKIYTALDTNKIYRWSGTVYVEITASPGSTDSVTEGSTNLYFTTARGQTAATGVCLSKANNLSDLANAATARTNLGLGTAATQASSAFDAAGAASSVLATSLQKASNLSDLVSASTARTNLGLGTAATSASTAFEVAGAASTAQAAAIAASCQRASNLSDVASAATARTNLGLGTAATQASSAFDASGAATTAQAFAIQRANHTGTQVASTISDFAATVLSTVLSGFSTLSSVAVVASDTILQAIGKLQAQINAINTAFDGWTELVSVTQLNNSSNTTLTNISELQKTCTTGITYRIEATIMYRSAAGGTGIALTMGTPDTAAGTIACSMRTPIAGDGTACEYSGAITALGDLVISNAVPNASTNYIAKIEGIFVCTAGGIICPQFRSEVSGSQISIMAGSVMLYREF